MDLESSHPKLNHDNIIEALMVALTAIIGNSITIQIYNFCKTTTAAWIDMQIIHFKKFCVPVSTRISRISKGDKLLKIPSDSI